MYAESATIKAAADELGVELLRVNLSSRVTIEDLLGRVVLGVGEVFKFVEGPVLKAARDGHWLLLDELNLAPDAVLAVLETMIDTKRLVVADSSNAEESSRVVDVHDNFRLFATENPAAGHFKGCRDELSTAFITRFAKITFAELPQEEWQEIVAHKLAEPLPESKERWDNADGPMVAGMMVEVHMQLQARLRAADWPEDAGYATVSIRELLRWCDHMRCYRTTWQQRFRPRGELDLPALKEALAFEVSCIYTARFRKRAARLAIQEVADHYLVQLDAGLPIKWSVRTTADNSAVRVLEIGGFEGNMRLPNKHTLQVQLRTEYPHTQSELSAYAAAVHSDCEALLRDATVMAKHGCYTSSSTWLRQWLHMANDVANAGVDKKLLGAALYLVSPPRPPPT